MNVQELLDLVNQCVQENGLSLDSAVSVEVFHDDDTETNIPATMVSCHVERGELTI